MSLEDRLNQDDGQADAWMPAVGDTLIGIITQVGRRETEYGEYFIWTVQTKEGTRHAVHAFHAVLANELAKYRLREGAEIGIKYLGKPEGKRYEMYKVVSDAEVNMSAPEAGPVPGDVSNDFTPTDAAPQQTGVKTPADDDIPF